MILGTEIILACPQHIGRGNRDIPSPRDIYIYIYIHLGHGTLLVLEMDKFLGCLQLSLDTYPGHGTVVVFGMETFLGLWCFTHCLDILFIFIILKFGKTI